LKKFQKTFGRKPTEFEVEKAKYEGWTTLLEWTRTPEEEEKEGEEDIDSKSDEEEQQVNIEEEGDEGRQDGEWCSGRES
jgi:hypothetical protein